MPTPRTCCALAVALLAVAACTSPGHRDTATRATPAAETAAGWSAIGHSAHGRPIERASIGSGPHRVLIIGGIHGNEGEGLTAIDRLAAHLAANARSLDASIVIVRDVNPDGAAAGTRANARGVDLNRNWPARNFTPALARGPHPLSEPESAALHRLVESFAPHLVIVFHSTPSGPFVNYDGPAEPQATLFADAAARADHRWRVVPNIGYPTPGSLGSYLGEDRAVPILTVEFQRGHDPDAAWRAVRDGVTAVLRGVGDGP